jgi:secreted trypsin-like serine protease
VIAWHRQHHRGAIPRALSLESLESRQLLSAPPIGGHVQKMPGNDRIVGGSETTVGNWPWMASLQSFGHFCGGSLVAADAVVTAAHCVEGSSVDDFQVVVGRHNLAVSDGKVHQVSEIIVHPDYEPFSNDSDIAVILLASASEAKPLRVLQPDQSQWTDAGRTARVLGWGRLTEGGELPDRLHEVSVPIVSNEVANADIAYAGEVTERMLAAGLAAGGQDSCQGDSGGPLLVNDDDGQPYVAGIVSWGEGCARPNKYGVYTRAASFASWIDDVSQITSAGSVNFTQERYGINQTAFIHMKDSDLIGTAVVQVDVSTSSGDIEPLVLAETTPGRFFGSIPLSQSAISIGNQSLDVQGGEQLQVTYRDTDHGGGEPATVHDTAMVVIDDYGNEPQFSADVVPAVPVDGEIEISGDVDWFRLVASAETLYQIDVILAGSLDDSVIELYDATGEVMLASNDDGGVGFASRLTWRPAADGPVLLKVFGYGTHIGSYQLVVSESIPLPDDHGHDALSASDVPFDQAVDGQLSSSDDLDWFSFIASAGSSYEITADLLTLSDSVLRLIDIDGQTELAYNDDGLTGLGSRITWTAQTTGRRYIEVSGYEGSVGDYRLNVHAFIAPPDDHGHSPDTATPITLPANVPGDLAELGDVDWFAFEAYQGTTYQLDVVLTSLVDSVLRLFDGEGNKLASNDDFQDELASRITWSAPQDGVYYVEVSSYGQQGTGEYRLLAKAVGMIEPDDHGNDADSASAIELPAQIQAQIASGGDVDWFAFSAISGLIYRMRTSAGTLNDTIMRLIDSDGVTELARNDDYGTTLTSYLQWRALDTETLYVEVSGYSQAQGTYEVSVSVPYGDVNLDGVFDSRDLVQVFQRGEYEDGLAQNSRWEGGDWNGDKEFGTADLVAAFQAGAYSTDSPAEWRDAVFALETEWNGRRGREDWGWLIDEQPRSDTGIGMVPVTRSPRQPAQHTQTARDAKILVFVSTDSLSPR